MNQIDIPIGAKDRAQIPLPMAEEDFELLIETLHLWKSRIAPGTKERPNPWEGEPNWGSLRIPSVEKVVLAARALLADIEHLNGYWDEDVDNKIAELEDALKELHIFPPQDPKRDPKRKP